MMSLRRVGLAGLVLIAAGSDVRAQTAPDCGAYATRAIRVEPGGMFRSSKIIRGYNTEFLKLSHRSAALDSLMQVSDSALAYAIDYRRSAGRASIVMGVASLTSFVLPLVVDFGDSRNAAIKWSSYGVTTVLWLHGSAVQRRANRSLSRAIWHYNLAVAEDTVRACAAASAPADPS